MRVVALLVPALALSACGLYDDSGPAEGSFAGAGGGESSAPPPVECAPKSLGTQTGELVPPSALVSRGVGADGCDPSFPGDAQYSWTAPVAGCYTISTIVVDNPGDMHSAKSTLKITHDSCDGEPVLCSTDNYGYGGQIGPFAQGERLVIAFTKTAVDTRSNHLQVPATADAHSFTIVPSRCRFQ